MEADNILVVNGESYAKSIIDLGRIIFDLGKFVRDPETFKLILFTGGEDVSPKLYGETSPKNFCRNNPNRDRKEKLIFKRAIRNKIKMTGICRGAQFLNVMAGGKLVHHFEGHASLGTHGLACSKNDKIIQVNSLHHQMIIPPSDGYIIAWSPNKLSEYYLGDKDLAMRWPGPEVEGIYLPKIRACAVQGHPEMMPKESEGFVFYRQMVADFLDMSAEDFSNEYTGRKREKSKAGFV